MKPQLGWYTVKSVEIGTGRIFYSNIWAVSVEDALRFESGRFGAPFFRILTAFPKLN